MKIVTVVGARPQFVKCAPVSRMLRKHATEVLIHTGQHYDTEMSAVFFHQLDIPKPDYNLNVGSGPHGHQTGEMLKGIEAVLLDELPDAVLVYGDTNSTLAGALAAVKLHIPVAHMESGLRSFNRRMPEEINRIVTDQISAMLFCPTQTAVENLAQEGIRNGVYLIGDVMYDVVLRNLALACDRSELLSKLSLTAKQYLLATVHRAENTDSHANLSAIAGAFVELAASGETIVFPVHPRTKTLLHSLSLDRHPRILLLEPVAYLDMLCLEHNAKAILTDSGGVQKEAMWLSVSCITLREETEWLETVQSGWNVIVGANRDRIVNEVRHLRLKTDLRRYVAEDGHAAERAVKTLIRYLDRTATSAAELCSDLAKSSKPRSAA